MSGVSKVGRPPQRALLVYDGDCAFCRRWVAGWQRLVKDRVGAIPSQQAEVAARFPELTRDALDSAVHLIEPNGRVTRGAEAVFRSLAGVCRWPLWLYQRVPGCAAVSESVYRYLARRRRCLVREREGK